MDLENLSQFDKGLFKKFLGLYVKKQREVLDYSLEKLSDDMSLPIKSLKLIESGQFKLTQEIFNQLCLFLVLDQNELLNIGRITQVNSLMGIYKEIDEYYPC